MDHAYLEKQLQLASKLFEVTLVLIYSHCNYRKKKEKMLNLCILYLGGELDLTTQERDEEETRCYDDFPDNSDVMWMKMALMAASWAEIPRETEDMPSVGCVIRRSRTRGSPAVLAVGWNGFLPNTPEKELNEIKGRSFKKPNEQQKRDNALTAELGLHAETNALQYCSETPEKATVYVTHMPCYKCTKQLVAHKVGRVFYLYWITYPDVDSKTTMSLFEKFDISCIAFSKRDKVLKDFNPNFLGLRGIVRGDTDDKTPPERCPSFLDSRDRKQTTWNCIIV